MRGVRGELTGSGGCNLGEGGFEAAAPLKFCKIKEYFFLHVVAPGEPGLTPLGVASFLNVTFFFFFYRLNTLCPSYF